MNTPEIRISPDNTMIAYRMSDVAGQSNTPWLMLALTARGEQQGRFTDARVADWTPLVPQDRVTCPWCGREERALTSTGRIRRHQRGPAEPGAAVVCKGTGRKPSEYRAPAPSVGADPEDAALLAVAEDRARRDTGERHDLDEVLAELREDERQHATFNPPMAPMHLLAQLPDLPDPTGPLVEVEALDDPIAPGSTGCVLIDLVPEWNPGDKAVWRIDADAPGEPVEIVKVVGTTAFVASGDHRYTVDTAELSPPAAVADTAHERTEP